MAPKARTQAKAKAKGKARPAPTVATKAKSRPEPKAKGRPEPKAKGRPEPKAKGRPEPKAPVKRKPDEKVAAPPAKRAAPAPANNNNSGASGRTVDSRVPQQGLKVIDDYAVTLNQTNVGANNNKYYIIQALEGGGKFFAWNRWGRVGDSREAQTKFMPCGSRDHAIKEFESKFRDKTQNQWAQRANFKKVAGKYALVETEESGGNSKEAPMGKLTEQQIGKGQAALDNLAKALAKGKMDEVTEYSSQFYSLIPHNFGWKKPVAISTQNMLQEKQELLKFFLRMGFEQVEADKDLTPIAGVLQLPVPKDLNEAAAGCCGQGDIASSNKKGAELAAKQAGKPMRKMDASLYAAIMLYTSNAIYADLNRSLRNKDRAKIKKYFKYLRLLFEAMGTLQQKKVTLWRGLSVDLINDPQYVPGSTVVWWGVSSCTSDQKVARGFANGCGTDCTLVTVHSKTACDISVISFFSNEKESLLPPGTELKVKSRKKVGKITEIELEEIGSAIK